ALLEAPTVVGDFDGDGILDTNDIDLLTDAVHQPNAELRFDLNGDSAVTLADREVWVEGLRGTYFGDANLDGEFSSADFVAVFQIGEYEDAVDGNSTWADGDWNGDRDFTSGDFVLAFQAGGYELGPRQAVSMVPEPGSLFTAWLGLLSVTVFGTQRRNRR
ncbi:MAG: hypothetical protein KDB23_34390, partial [Planctomycetales bacterium]|nr:hypothetical protein [Planctomycetales bacterium]